jgi:hypothetical protein
MSNKEFILLCSLVVKNAQSSFEDQTKVIELSDETDLAGELACAGGVGCEIV